MKYYLVSWTAEDNDGESFSGNATMQWDGDSPTDEEIVSTLKSANPKLSGFYLTLQDKLEFDSQEALDKYGSR